MIKPIYFPHTYLSPAAAEAIRTFFPVVAAYQPVAGRQTPDMQALADSGFLETVAPGPENQERLERILKELERWGSLQQGGAGLLSAFLSSRPGFDPLATDGSPARIAAEIRGRPVGPPPEQDAAVRAAVFLQLAHQADHQGCQLSAELQACESAHARVLRALTGRSARPASVAAGAAAPEEERLLRQRLKAWARLFLQHPLDGPVFVTTSTGVIGLLADKHPALRPVSRAELDNTAPEGPASLKPAGGNLMELLAGAASRSLPAAGFADHSGGITSGVYVLPGMPPRALFADLAGDDALPMAADGPPQWRNTVIVGLAKGEEPSSETGAAPAKKS
jgi:hypothetical protein